MRKVVALGGGTGLATLLRGLKRETDHLTAIVTVTDDGGSSGRLRQDLGVLPPGDLRNCLVALADDESLMRKLFMYRFEAGELAGHSFGNLFLAALAEVTGDFERAVLESSHVLAVRGTVLPSTLSDVRLHARLVGGAHVSGETAIGRAPEPIEHVWIDPPDARALPQALERIRAADVVVLGPGSLYTSIVPNLLVDGIVDALRDTEATVVFVANVMTQQRETIGYSAADHLDCVLEYVGPEAVDVMVVNDRPVPSSVLERYEEEGAEPVVWNGGPAGYRDVRVVAAPLVEVDRLVRHDPALLARLVLEQARE